MSALAVEGLAREEVVLDYSEFRRLGEFKAKGSGYLGTSQYVVGELMSEESSDHDTILGVADEGMRLKAVVALEDLDTGEPLVDIIQIGGSLDQHPRLLEGILRGTTSAVHVRRLRLGSESNVSADVLNTTFSRDQSDPTHTTFVFPRV